MERRSGARLAGILFLVGGAALAAHTIAGESRDWPFRAAMSLVIAGIGAAFFLLGPADRGSRVLPELAVRHPEEPWLWREDWSRGFACSDTRSRAKEMGLAGTVCLLISVPIAFQLPGELSKGNHAAWVALVFPAAGVFLAGTAIVGFLRHRKFRGARFEMARVPGALGGKLSGRIVIGFPVEPGTPVELTLSCVHSYASRRDSDRTRWQRVLWQTEATATALSDGSTVCVPVEFTVPCDAQATDGRDPDDEMLWRLGAAAQVSGLDFRTTFTTPVFRTTESDSTLTTERLDAERQRRSHERPDGRTGGTQFHLPAARHKTAAAALTAFGLLSVGSGGFFGYLLRQWLGWFGFLLPFVPIGGLGMLLLLIAASLWFRSTTIEVANRELRIRTSWLGMERWRVIEAGEVARLELHSGMQRGDQVWYDLRVHLVVGGKVTAGDGMTRKEADWLAAEVRRELGVKE